MRIYFKVPKSKICTYMSHICRQAYKSNCPICYSNKHLCAIFFVRRLADKNNQLSCLELFHSKHVNDIYVTYVTMMIISSSPFIRLSSISVFFFVCFTALFRSVPHLFLSARQHSISVILLTILHCTYIEQFLLRKSAPADRFQY